MTETESKSLDKFIGNKIKERRKALGLTQSELSEILGVSHQQVQRYESGENTISLPRILELEKILNVRTGYFYEDAKIDSDFVARNKNDYIKKDSTRPIKILLVEDNANDELLFRKAASKSIISSDIFCIQNPEKVIPYLKQTVESNEADRPDIIVMDINMPRISGITLLKEIKRDVSIKSLPVVMFTNSIRTKDMLDSYSNNANGFIQKNSDLNDFYSDIDSFLKYWRHTTVLPNMA